MQKNTEKLAIQTFLAHPS